MVPHDLLEILETIRTSEPEDLHTGSYVTGESMLDAYVPTLHLNYLKDRHPVRADATLQEWKEFFLDKISVSRGPIDVDSIKNQYTYHWVRSRTFVMTEESYIGAGSAGAQPGTGTY